MLGHNATIRGTGLIRLRRKETKPNIRTLDLFLNYHRNTSNTIRTQSLGPTLLTSVAVSQSMRILFLGTQSRLRQRVNMLSGSKRAVSLTCTGSIVNGIIFNRSRLNNGLYQQVSSQRVMSRQNRLLTTVLMNGTLNTIILTLRGHFTKGSHNIFSMNTQSTATYSRTFLNGLLGHPFSNSFKGTVRLTMLGGNKRFITQLGNTVLSTTAGVHYC